MSGSEMVIMRGDWFDNYQVEVASSVDSMRDKVLALRDDGWQLYGGVAIAVDGHGLINYAQAMIKVLPPVIVQLLS